MSCIKEKGETGALPTWTELQHPSQMFFIEKQGYAEAAFAMAFYQSCISLNSESLTNVQHIIKSE